MKRELDVSLVMDNVFQAVYRLYQKVNIIYALPWVIFIFCSALTFQFWQSTKTDTSTKQEADFNFRANDVVNHLQQHIRGDQQVLVGINGLYASSDKVEQTEFHHYINSLDLQQNNPEIRQLYYVQPFSSEYPASDEQTGHYCQVTFVASLGHIEQEVPGNDVCVDQQQYDALQQTIRNGSLSIIGTSTASAGMPTGQATTVSMVLPVYEKRSRQGLTQSDQTKRLLGWISAELQIDTLVNNILDIRRGEMDIEIFDGEVITAQSLLYDDNRIPNFTRSSTYPFSFKKHITIADHHWTIAIFPEPAYFSESGWNKAVWIMTIGIGASLLLGWITWLLVRGKDNAMRYAARMNKALIAREELLKEAQHIAHLGSWELDYTLGTLSWSDELYALLELEKQDRPITDEDCMKVVHPEDRQAVEMAYKHSLKNQLPYDITHRLLMPDGRIKWVIAKGNITYDATGNPLRSVGTLQDISEQKQTEEEINTLAFYDVVTGLANRRLLMSRLTEILAAMSRGTEYGALIFLDIDNFKTLNDSMGHEAGDSLLSMIAERLKTCFRESDVISRVGGDEFVVVIDNIKTSEEEALQKIAHIAEEARSALVLPYQIKGSIHYSSPSIGVCLFNGSENEADELLKRADMAMYQAKESGKNRIRFFDPKMQQIVEERVALESDLRFAISEQQFQLFYQIQVDRDGQAIGAEALIRWNHPQRGMVPPFQFIPVAEDSTLILDIGHWVLECACQQLQAWQDNEILHSLELAVNVSAQQFKQPDFVNQVKAVIDKYAISPARLKLELTESVALNDINSVVEKMSELREKVGVKLSLDDFGTGYSSLSYLKKLPLHQLKIDKSFIRDMTTDTNDTMMVKTIIDMAQNFGMQVIAEGVETEEQQHYLRTLGCDAFQGYLFSKPVPVDAFEVFVSEQLASVTEDDGIVQSN